MKTKIKLIIIASMIGIAFGLFYYFDLGAYLRLEYIQLKSLHFLDVVHNNYLTSVLIYIASYALIVAAGLPGIAPVAVLGGFLFGAPLGVMYSIVAAVLGSLGAYLIIKHLIRDMIHSKYGSKLENFRTQINTYGYSYILTLHFMTVIPYVLINALAALVEIPIPIFMVLTAIGSAPLFVVYAYAGRELHTIHSVHDIFQPHIMILFGLLLIVALLPMILRKFKRTY